jgi:hypothetical protein
LVDKIQAEGVSNKAEKNECEAAKPTEAVLDQSDIPIEPKGETKIEEPKKVG